MRKVYIRLNGTYSVYADNLRMIADLLDEGGVIVNESGRRLPCYYISHVESEDFFIVHSLGEAESCAFNMAEIVPKESWIKLVRNYV